MSEPSSNPDARMGGQSDEAAQAEAMRQLQEELASAPVEVVVMQAAAHLATYAYVRLGIPPEENDRFRDLAAARVLVDAFAGLVQAMRGRLGRAEDELEQALAGLHMTYAQLAAGAEPGPEGGAEPPPSPAPEEPRLHRPSSGLWVPGQD
jgi:Domain of unknown function (DUF1844)